MSVFIKKSKLRVKNEDGTSYTGVMNAVAEESTEELIKQIEAKGEEAVEKGKKTLESIPEDYAELNGMVDGLNEDLINKVVIQKGKVEETNCDLITKNGIYEINTDFKNTPSMKQNGILVVMTSGNISSRIVQMVYEWGANDGTNKKAWIRFAKSYTATTFWGEWVSFLLDDAFNDSFNTVFDDAFNDAFNTVFNDAFNDVFNTVFDDAFNDIYHLSETNLFDGNYISGYGLTGHSLSMKFTTNDNCNSIAIIKVKPNKKYSIIIEDKGAESTGNRYFKGAFYNGIYTRPSELVGKSITPVFSDTDGTKYIKNKTVTTLEDTTYMIVMTALTTQPFLQVFEGDITDFTTHSYSNRYLLNDIRKDLSIKYNSDSEYDICFGKYSMKLFYSELESADMHNWNIGKIYYGSEIIVPAGTDIIGPIKISGDADFLSGVHGSSTTTTLQVYCDGVKTTLDDNLNKKCDKITIFMVDECRSEKTLEHVFDRYVTIEITKNKIHICNMFKCVSSSPVTVERATNGGLMAVRNNILTGASMNNYICTEAPSTTIRNSSKQNTHAVLTLTMGSITIDNIIGKENETYKGFFNVFVNENPVRTKTYFDIMRNEQVTNGREIVGEFEYLFN